MKTRIRVNPDDLYDLLNTALKIGLKEALFYETDNVSVKFENLAKAIGKTGSIKGDTLYKHMWLKVDTEEKREKWRVNGITFDAGILNMTSRFAHKGKSYEEQYGEWSYGNSNNDEKPKARDEENGSYSNGDDHDGSDNGNKNGNTENKSIYPDDENPTPEKNNTRLLSYIFFILVHTAIVVVGITKQDLDKGANWLMLAVPSICFGLIIIDIIANRRKEERRIRKYFQWISFIFFVGFLLIALLKITSDLLPSWASDPLEHAFPKEVQENEEDEQEVDEQDSTRCNTIAVVNCEWEVVNCEWWECLSVEWRMVFREKIGLQENQNPTKEYLDKIRQIVNLDISSYGTNIDNLKPISALTNLAGLWCRSTYIDSLEPLQDLNKLTYLDVSFTNVSTLEHIISLENLSVLTCTCTNIPKKQLQELTLNGVDIKCESQPL